MSMPVHYRFKISPGVEAVPLCETTRFDRAVEGSIIYKPVKRNGDPITSLCSTCRLMARSEGVPDA